MYQFSLKPWAYGKGRTGHINLYLSRAGRRPLVRIWVAAGRGNRITAIYDYCRDCTCFTKNLELLKEYPPAGIKLALEIFIPILNPTP